VRVAVSGLDLPVTVCVEPDDTVPPGSVGPGANVRLGVRSPDVPVITDSDALAGIAAGESVSKPYAAVP